MLGQNLDIIEVAITLPFRKCVLLSEQPDLVLQWSKNTDW